ncbi:MAG TPA: MFS transporter [Aeromicrobium sp.]|nr:MFS transporter [Aeromicrobium sp.]
MTTPEPLPDAARPLSGQPWLTPGVRGIGVASLLSDLGHEIPTALLPSFLTTVLGAPAAALGLIEGIADALSGVAKVFGGALADDRGRRRSIAVGGYTLTAILSALIGISTAVWQVAIFRTAAWTARGIRGPSRNALLADAVDPTAYGRAYGFERAMDNAGAVIGPIVALGLVALIGIREAIFLSVIPGLLAAVAIVYAVRHLQRPKERHTTPVRIVVRPLLRGPLGRLLVSVSLFEAGNVAATLLILRTTELLTPSQGTSGATTIAIALYVGYNVAGTLAALPAGRLADAHGARLVFAVGVACFALAYLAFATGSGIVILGLAFVLAGVGIGAAETAENAAVAALAPSALRGSAFGLLAGIQSAGDFIASAVVGLVWTLVSPALAFGLAATLMVGSLVTMAVGRRSRPSEPSEAPG